MSTAYVVVVSAWIPHTHNNTEPAAAHGPFTTEQEARDYAQGLGGPHDLLAVVPLTNTALT